MAKLIYMIQTSLDGFIEDTEGNFDFAVPSPEVHQYVNDLQRTVGTHLYGRRLYETMAVWQTMDFADDSFPELEEASRDYQQIWLATDKIVYSSTLEEIWTPRTELRAEFDVDAVRALKDSASADIVIGGPGLASAAFAAGIVDEINTTAFPVTIGGGKPAFPTDMRLDLDLLDERRFEDGAVHLHYKVN